jgi:PPK2 family polyphosphate:nucleotide phosphotransferase
MKIKLEEINTRAERHLDKEEIKKETKKIVKELSDLQNVLYAEAKHAVLVIIQGMDASGKDGAIKNVFGKLNAQGVGVISFKKPTEEELAHDFLWRIHKNTPAKGMIHVFNRSQYEDIVVTRVHGIINDSTAANRMEAINNFEQLLADNNTTILKFYLHASEKKRMERLEERVSNPAKRWKYNKEDMKEAERWPEYRKMYEDAFSNCNVIPWTIVPADQNWYKEYLIASALRDKLLSLDMKYPDISKKKDK